MLSDEDYADFLEVLNNKHIIRVKPHLKWASALISARKLQVIKIETLTGYEDIIIKPKDREDYLLPNSSNYLKLAKVSQIEGIISKAHIDGSHCGVRATYNRIRKDYCFISRDVVLEFVNRCKVCPDTSFIPAKRLKPSMSIVSKAKFYHMLIDLIDYSETPAGPELQYKYIIHASDLYSSFHFADAVVNKSAVEVLHFIR